MFVYTVTKKRAMRAILLGLAVLVGIAIAIVAIFTAVNKSSAEERQIPIYSVDREENGKNKDNKISITFDCAWGNSNTDELLSILEKEDVKATFFVTGEFCDKYKDDVLKISKAGHEIQNHSDKHPHIEGINVNELIEDTRNAEKKIAEITGITPTLYRAPYGEYDDSAVFTINGMGYNFIQWSVDSIDWQEPSAKTIISRVTKNTKPGSILLFHNDLENTTEALPEVLAKLKNKGFEFVKVSDLLHKGDCRIDNEGKQLAPTSKANVDVHVATGKASSAFETLVKTLTIEELMSLENGLTPPVMEKLSKALTAEEIEAISRLSEDEIKSAFGTLVEAKITGQMGVLEENGTTTSATTADPTVTTTPNAATAPSVTTDIKGGGITSTTAPVTTASPATTKAGKGGAIVESTTPQSATTTPEITTSKSTTATATADSGAVAGENTKVVTTVEDKG